MNKITDAQKLEANREAARQANNEVALYAGDFAQHFMAGSFSAAMYVERSSEVAEPGLFEISTEPDQLETRRMTGRHWLRFDVSLLNEELLARRFIRELEYEFVLVLDISRSLTNGWFDSLRAGQWNNHTTFRIKYLAYTLLNSAIHEGFACRVLFVDQGRVIVRTGREDTSFPFAVIEIIDELIAERDDPPEAFWMWESVLRNLAVSSEQMLVAVISDFLDPVQLHGIDEDLMLGSLSRLRFNKRLMVMQLNNDQDVHDDHPVSRSPHEIAYGETGDKRRRGEQWVVTQRARLCDWLGRKHQERQPGRLEESLTAERVPFQKFLASENIENINQRLENLIHGVLQD